MFDNTRTGEERIGHRPARRQRGVCHPSRNDRQNPQRQAADRRRVSGIAARRPRGLHLRRAGQGRDDASGLSQHRADDRAAVRRAARPDSPRQASRCRPTPATAGKTHAFFKAPKTLEDLIAGRDAIAEWARLTYGWMGRSPDYKAAFLGTLGANADFYAPYQDNARRWYTLQPGARAVRQPRDHPSAGRSRPPAERGRRRLRARGEGDRRRHHRLGRQGGRDRLGADQLHLRRPPRPDPAAGQEVRPRLHGADQRAGREVDLPDLVRDDGGRDGRARSTIRCPRASTRTTPSSSWTRCSCRGRTSSSTATSRRPTTSSRAPASCRASSSTAARGSPSSSTSSPACC